MFVLVFTDIFFIKKQAVHGTGLMHNASDMLGLTDKDLGGEFIKKQAVHGTGLMQKNINPVKCTASQNPKNLTSCIGTLDKTSFSSCKITKTLTGRNNFLVILKFQVHI